MTARTLSDGAADIVRRARAFASQHERLIDDLSAALVAILAVLFWYGALALFAH